MERVKPVFRMFQAPEGYECEALFCIYETYDSFWGFKIEEEVPERGVQVYFGKRKPANIRYINCDHFYQFPKNVHYEKIFTRYKLKELREAVVGIQKSRANTGVLKGDKFEIKDYDAITPEQRQNRKNPELHKKLKDAIGKRERAIIMNDSKTEKELTEIIDDLKAKLGYKDPNPQKYKLQLKDTVTNSKPFQGGSCTPK